MFIMTDMDVEELIREEREKFLNLHNPIATEADVGRSLENKALNQAFSQTGSCSDRLASIDANRRLNFDFGDTALDNTCFFGELSDELVLRIFAHLPLADVVNCTLVCKYWRRVGCDPSLWRKINLDGKCFNQGGCLGRVLHRGVEVVQFRKAQVHGRICAGCPDEGWCKRVRSHGNDVGRCGNFKVRYLDASMSRFSNDLLLSLLLKCNQLVKLSLEGLALGESELRAIGKNGNLRVLNLAFCRGLTTNGIQDVALNCRKLKSLNLSWTGVTKEAVETVCRCVKLQKLNLSGLKEAVDSKVFERLVESCKLLTHLDLSDCTGITNTSLRLICNRCSRLRKLSLSRCFSIDPDHLNFIVELRHLTHLDILGFNHAESLIRLQKANPELRINKEHLSSMAGPLPTLQYDGRLWEQYVGYLV